MPGYSAFAHKGSNVYALFSVELKYFMSGAGIFVDCAFILVEPHVCLNETIAFFE